MADTQYVDINNLPTVEEPLGDQFDPKANLFSFTGATVPQGTYLVAASFAEADPEKQWVARTYKDGRGTYYSTQLKLEILEGDFAGRRLFDTFLSTGIWGENASSKAASFCLVTGYEQELAQCHSHEDVVRLTTRVLSTTPQVKAFVKWRGYGPTNDPETGKRPVVARKMGDFPKNDLDGTYQNTLTTEDPVTGDIVEVPARVEVESYFPANKGGMSAGA